MYTLCTFMNMYFKQSSRKKYRGPMFTHWGTLEVHFTVYFVNYHCISRTISEIYDVHSFRYCYFHEYVQWNIHLFLLLETSGQVEMLSSTELQWRQLQSKVGFLPYTLHLPLRTICIISNYFCLQMCEKIIN